eukprot:9482958-Pyramimonas_sp.AAC.1
MQDALGKCGGATLADSAVNLGVDDAAGRSRRQGGRGKTCKRQRGRGGVAKQKKASGTFQVVQAKDQ